MKVSVEGNDTADFLVPRKGDAVAHKLAVEIHIGLVVTLMLRLLSGNGVRKEKRGDAQASPAACRVCKTPIMVTAPRHLPT